MITTRGVTIRTQFTTLSLLKDITRLFIFVYVHYSKKTNKSNLHYLAIVLTYESEVGCKRLTEPVGLRNCFQLFTKENGHDVVL